MSIVNNRRETLEVWFAVTIKEDLVATMSR